MPSPPYPTRPVPPLGMPLIVSFCFWGRVYGAQFGLALPGLPRRAPLWLLGLGLGLLAVLMLWFVVAPLRRQPVANGFVPIRMLVSTGIHGVWGAGRRPDLAAAGEGGRGRRGPGVTRGARAGLGATRGSADRPTDRCV
jgi:hypothetical protein